MDLASIHPESTIRLEGEGVPGTLEGTITAPGGRRSHRTSAGLFVFILASLEASATPEGIVQSFPALKLGDVYAVLGYYLRHKSEVDRQLDLHSARLERSSV